jgi:homoserine kinase
VLTLAVLGHDEHAGDPASAAEVRALRDHTPAGWECRPLRVDHTGAVVTPLDADHDAVSFHPSGTRS